MKVRMAGRAMAYTALSAMLTALPAACASGGPGAETPSPNGPTLTDAEIAHVAVTANAIDAELARLAESRASAASIRRFAETMVSDHTAVNERAAALASRLGVTPRNNAASRELRAGADDARRSLERLRGAAFDTAYMEREVAYHGAVLNALDETLIPGASNAELRSLLEEVRPAIAAHLEHARTILAGLDGGR